MARISPSDLDNRFAYHPPSSEGKKKDHEDVRELCRELAGRLVELMPEGREAATAITKLEEVQFWANAAVARLDGNVRR